MRYHKLDLNLLAVLDALLVHKNVTRAADQLCLAQPSVSNSLSRLREHFQDELLVMVGRKMVLTPLAESLRQPVCELLANARRVAQMRATFDPIEANSVVSVIASDYILSIFLPTILRSLGQKAPSIRLALTPPHDDVIKQFRSGNFHFMILPDYITGVNAGTEPLFVDRFVPIASIESNFAEPITWREYISAQHIAIKLGTQPVCDVVDYCLPEHEKRKIVMYIPGFNLAASFLSGTNYLLTVPELFAYYCVGKYPVKILQTRFPLPEIKETLHWPIHLQTDPANIWMRGLIQQTFSSLTYTDFSLNKFSSEDAFYFQ